MDFPSTSQRERCPKQVKKLWRLLPCRRSDADRLAEALGLSPLVAQLLCNRGLDAPGAAKRFLDAPFNGLHEPALLPGIAEATSLLLEAARRGDSICVYGDYDVDGLTGTAILLQTLRLLGARADFYVPHRLEEGYGLSIDALKRVAASRASVVVTVDCGIASVEEAQEAKRLGLCLIITDHHEPKQQLPAAAAVVHPRLPNGAYPFGELSGSGVAFKLAWSLCQAECGTKRVTSQFRDFLVDSVGLAALGMVADWVPLLDENRIVVRHGLSRLAGCASEGMKALLDAAGLGRKAQLCTTDISFAIAPRLNAAGRLGCARLVVELLTTPSQQRALELTRFLESQNEQRKQIEQKVLQEARQMIEEQRMEESPALVLARPGWHAGVIGIVAGRLAEQYQRPVLLIALRDGESLGQGSGRSVPGFALHEALMSCGEHLSNHGGHAAAAGFRIRPDAIDGFRHQFCRHASDHFGDTRPMSELLIDGEIPLSALTMSTVADLSRLEPFGAANPRPTFLAGPVRVVGEPRRVGRGERHLQFRVNQQGTILPVIGFQFADRADELMTQGGECCLVFRPSLNEWQGYRNVQLEMLDFQPGPRVALA